MSAGYRPKDDSALTWADMDDADWLAAEDCDDGETFASCCVCGEEHPEGVLEDGFCPSCVDDDEHYEVSRSGGLLP